MRRNQQIMADWRKPQDWTGETFPSEYGDRRVRLLVDFGCGNVEVAGRAYGIKSDVDGPMVVYSDIGGWCTQYVKGWRPTDAIRDEIDEDRELND